MYRQRLLEALKKLRDEGPDAQQGICGCVYYRLDYFDIVDTNLTLSRLEHLFAAFLNWKGPDFKYPVGGPVEYSEEKKAGTLWANPRRHELLHYCINRLDQELNLG